MNSIVKVLFILFLGLLNFESEAQSSIGVSMRAVWESDGKLDGLSYAGMIYIPVTKYFDFSFEPGITTMNVFGSSSRKRHSLDLPFFVRVGFPLKEFGKFYLKVGGKAVYDEDNSSIKTMLQSINWDTDFLEEFQTERCIGIGVAINIKKKNQLYFEYKRWFETENFRVLDPESIAQVGIGYLHQLNKDSNEKPSTH